MSFNTTPTSSTNNLPFMGIQEQNPRETYVRRRDPTINDYRGYKLGDRWINKSLSTAWILVSKANGIATWVGFGGAGGVISVNGCNGAITLAAGAAIDVVNACPIITLDVRVDNVTIQVNGANNLEVITAGILANLQFDPDVGANVSPVANIVQVPGIGGNQTLNGGAGILQFNNRRWLSSFVVDPSIVPGSDAEFTTIQAAITAANAVGGGVIYVRPGVYTENLVLEPNIDIIGVCVDGRAPKVSIIGDHTYSGNGLVLFDDIDFMNVATDLFTVTNAAGLGFLVFKNCGMDATAFRGIVLNPVGASSGVVFVESQLVCDLQCVDVLNSGFVNVLNSILNSSSQSIIRFIGSGSVDFRDGSSCSGTLNAVEFQNALASASCENSSLSAGAEVINFAVAGGSVRVEHSTFSSSAPGGFFITGTGTLDFVDLGVIGFATGIDPLVTVNKINWQPYGESGVLATAYRGTSAFDNTQFTVSDGFVELINGAPISGLGVDAFTAPGTDPVVPNGVGVIDITGAQATAGTISTAIRTNSLVANTVTIEVQRSSAQLIPSVAQNGVSHFASANFTVDAVGFVQLAGSVAQSYPTDSGTAIPALGVLNILGGPGVTTSAVDNTVTVNSVVFTDQAGSVAVTSDSGSFATAAITLTLPVAPLQGEMVIFSCTTAAALVVQAAGAQLIRLGTLVSSAGGSATSTSIGDTLVLRYFAAGDTWTAISIIGTWIMA